jgi:hypothetical protein
MIVELRKKNSRYPDLTFGQPYAVIGIEADDYRILNDAGRPFLYPSNLFRNIDSAEPPDWITEFGEDKERYSYPNSLNRPGFFEDFFDEEPKAVATFWQLINQRLPTSKQNQSTNQALSPTKYSSRHVSDWDVNVYVEAGVALGWAQLFEAEMVTVLLVYDVSGEQFRFRAEAENFIRTSNKRPLIRLLRQVLSRVNFEPDVSPKFEEAISARNLLVHHFLSERTWPGIEQENTSKMIDELRELTQLFLSAYKFAEMLRSLYFQQLGESEIRKLLSDEMYLLHRPR